MLDQNQPAYTQTATQTTQQTVERARALAFSETLRTLLQRQQFYVPLTGAYLLPQLYERIRMLDGHGIHINTLRAYLRGDCLPSDSKARLLADALAAPRGVLLYAAGYLTAEDLPHYPSANATLEGIEGDIREVEALPLTPATKQRIVADLRTSARILRLLHAERAQAESQAAPDEREQLIELLMDLWQTAAPPPPPLTSSEEALLEQRQREGAAVPITDGAADAGRAGAMGVGAEPAEQMMSARGRASNAHMR